MIRQIQTSQLIPVLLVMFCDSARNDKTSISKAPDPTFLEERIAILESRIRELESPLYQTDHQAAKPDFDHDWIEESIERISPYNPRQRSAMIESMNFRAQKSILS